MLTALEFSADIPSATMPVTPEQRRMYMSWDAEVDARLASEPGYGPDWKLLHGIAWVETTEDGWPKYRCSFCNKFFWGLGETSRHVKGSLTVVSSYFLLLGGGIPTPLYPNTPTPLYSRIGRNYPHPIIPQNRSELMWEHFRENHFLALFGAGWGTTWPYVRVPRKSNYFFAPAQPPLS